MSIRMLAAELYRVIREIEKLETEIKDSTPGRPEREERETKLREAIAERDRLRKMLEGAKET